MVTRILVTGSRACKDIPTARDQIRDALKVVRAEPFFANAVLVHGACTGADRIASAMWTSFGGKTEAYPAKWALCAPDCPPGHRRSRQDGSSFCPSAGFRRNKHMVDIGADLCLAFIVHQSPGASMTADLAEAAGIQTRRIEVTP